MIPNYRGPLTLSQLADACSKTIKNANELLIESEILFESNCYARALYLLRISNEELGKFYFLTNTILHVLQKTTTDWKTFWTIFRKHEEKTTISELVVSRLIKDDIYIVPNDDVQYFVSIWEHMKLSSLYVDIFEDQFRLPSDIVTSELIREVIEVMKKRLFPLHTFDVNVFIENELAKIDT